MPLVPYLLPPGLCPAAERGGLTVYSDIALDSSSLCNVQVDIHITSFTLVTLDLSLAHHRLTATRFFSLTLRMPFFTQSIRE